MNKANLTKVRNLYQIFSPREQKIFVILVCLGLVGLGGITGNAYRGITEIKPASGGSLTEGVIGRPSSINPLEPPQSDADIDLRSLVHAGLLTVDADGSLKPLLAESLPEISQDLKVYKIKLRPNLRWQDGKPITADDVVHTVKSIQGKDSGSYLRSSFRFVTVNKLDDLNVEFKLREASVTFTDNLLVPLIYNYTNGHLEDLDIIGAGPYKIKKYKFNSSQEATEVELASNEYFYPHEPYIRNITLKFYESTDELISAYKSGLIDNLGLFELPDGFKPGFGDRSITVKLPQYQAAFFNLEQSDILNRPKVREALSFGTNRQEIAAIYGSAQAIGGPILGSQTVPAPEYSPDKARAILEEDGWQVKEKGNHTHTTPPF